MISPELRHNLGKLFTDLGKYLLTALPFGYLLNTKTEPQLSLFLLILLVGVMFCFFGVRYSVNAEQLFKKEKELQRKGRKKKIKLLKNTTLVVEEE